jgi:hypothetical protein
MYQHRTADGYPLNVGDTVWVMSDVIGDKPYSVIVGKVLPDDSIVFKEPDSKGYVGARCCYHFETNAHWDC